MSLNATARSSRVYKIECGTRRRFVIYNSAEIGNPPDHEPDRWYFQPYPVPLGLAAGRAFNTAEEAERAAHVSH